MCCRYRVDWKFCRVETLSVEKVALSIAVVGMILSVLTPIVLWVVEGKKAIRLTCPLIVEKKGGFW